jgi:hypothetical protein
VPAAWRPSPWSGLVSRAAGTIGGLRCTPTPWCQDATAGEAVAPEITSTVMASSVGAAIGHGGGRPVEQAVRLRLDDSGSEAAEPLSVVERELPFGCVRGDEVVSALAHRDVKVQAEGIWETVGELPHAGERAGRVVHRPPCAVDIADFAAFA